VIINFDPLEKVLTEGGTALIYCAKSKIYDSSIINKFKKYVKHCTKITNVEALKIIDKVRLYIGASQDNFGDFSSLMVRWMKRGIVFHHGSLPLRVRLLIEEFTQKGFCKVCFATATLEQGINMPFDLVWIERLHNSRELSVKNLIGRAGRSTEKPVFDYGQVVIKHTKRKNLSKIIRKGVSLETESQLDNLVDPNDDYREYKEAIKNGTFSEEFNLTNSELNRIEMTTNDHVSFILSNLYKDNEIDFSKVDADEQTKTEVIDSFISIYQKYLDRPLTRGEDAVLSTAVKILFWRVKGKKFSQIVSYRYYYASQLKIRKDFANALSSNGKLENNYAIKNLIGNLKAQWITQYKPIPDRNFKTPLSLTYNKLATDVDYDRMVLDTYDYIDKLIGFRLGDVYYAAFSKYADNSGNNPYLREQAKSMLDLIKYGTNSKKEIWLLRYGFDFDDIEWLSPIVKSINEEEIVFYDLTGLDDDKKERILKFI
jgi:ATP-dependent RNA helicase DOB1